MTGVDTVLAEAEAALLEICDGGPAEYRAGVGDVIGAVRAEILGGPGAGSYVALMARLGGGTPDWRAGAEDACLALLGLIDAIRARRPAAEQ